MAPNSSLRKALRRIPAFRSLSGGELEAVIGQLDCKEYQPSAVLWRTSAQTDFLGIIQEGEVELTYLHRGVVMRTARFSAGELVLPRKVAGKDQNTVVLARAVTKVRLYVLRMNQLERLQKILVAARTRSSVSRRFERWLLSSRVWLVSALLVLLLLTWGDLARIASGVMYLEAATRYAPEDARQMILLKRAQWLDAEAVFAQNQEGWLLFQNNALDDARRVFLEAVDTDSKYGPALNNLAVAYFAGGQIQQALAFQEKAVENDPDQAVTHYNLGVALQAGRNYPAALREFKEAGYIAPAWAAPYLEQADLYLRMQDAAQAEKAAREALKRDPLLQPAYLILAIALSDQGQNQPALEAIQSALEINPTDRVARFYQARILGNLREFDLALEIYQKLLDSADDQSQMSRIAEEIEALHRLRQNLSVGAR